MLKACYKCFNLACIQCVSFIQVTAELIVKALLYRIDHALLTQSCQWWQTVFKRPSFLFNLPSDNIKPYFVNEMNQFTLNAYFVDPSTICSNRKRSYPSIGDRLVIKGDKLGRRIPTTTTEILKEGFWTLGKCFPLMGFHYYADVTGPVTVNTSADNLFPISLLFNNGNLIGFLW
jgi:hypothetical protein